MGGEGGCYPREIGLVNLLSENFDSSVAPALELLISYPRNGKFCISQLHGGGNWFLTSWKMSIFQEMRGVWCLFQEIVSGLHRGLSSVAQQHGGDDGETLKSCCSFGMEYNVLPSKGHVKL